MISVVLRWLNQMVGQGDGLVVIDVAGTEQQRQATAACEFGKRPELSVGFEFGRVTPAELIPSPGIVIEPLPQFRAGCDVGEPLIKLGSFAAHAARPEAIDEYAVAVVGARRLVDPFGDDVHSHSEELFRLERPRNGRPF